MVLHVAYCSTLERHESQYLWQPTADEIIARNHLEEAHVQSVKYVSNPVLHGNAALSSVYGSERAFGLGGLIVHWQALKFVQLLVAVPYTQLHMLHI